MIFKKIVSKFIHPTIQEDELLFTKAKTLLVLLLFFLFVLISYSSFFVFKGVFFNTKAVLNYLGLLVIICSLLLLKKSTNLLYPLRVINYVGMVLVTGGVYWSGGFASNDILWYLVVAVSSLLFISVMDGIVVTALTMLAIVGFYVVDIFELINFPFDPFTRGIHYRFINSVIIILILVFLVYVLVKRNNNLQKVVQDIQASQIREAISRDFHDELGNKLASIVHISKRLKNTKSDEDKLEMLHVIEEESQNVYDNFRDFIWTNDPNSLKLSSLFVYLTDFNQQFFTHRDIRVEGKLLPEDDVWDEKVTPIIVRHIIPIFKEIMTNVYKYAEASTVDWSILWTREEFVLKVKDDGIGFDVESVPKGQGLKNINKRASELQAEYEVLSTVGNGTTTILRVKL